MLQQQMLLQHQQQQLKQQQEAQVQAQAQAQAQSTQAQQQQQQQQASNVAQVSQLQPGKQEVMSSEAAPTTSGNHVAPQATPTTATTATESIWGAKGTHDNNGTLAKITIP